MYRLLTLLFPLFLLACGGNTPSSETAATKQAPPPPQQQADAEGYTNPYPSISNEKMKDIWENCTLIDYVFYDLPISMNMNDKPGIQSALRQISADPAKVMDICKPAGRVFYQNSGVSQAEADFYFNGTCLYFLFLENNKPYAGNQMTAQGVTFFKDVIASAQKAGQ